MAKNKIALPQAQAIPAGTIFQKENDELRQYMFFRKPQKKTTDLEFDLPLGKALKGSITYLKDPTAKDGKHIQQCVRIYNKYTTRKTVTVHDTKYSRVTVSKSRATVSFSFPLCEDPLRLVARLQNFANIIIDESDEIAAMLNQEGAARVQEAWKELNNAQISRV